MSPEVEPSSPMRLGAVVATPTRWMDFVGRRPQAIAATAETVVLRQAHVFQARAMSDTGRRAYSADPPGYDHWDDAPPFVDGVRTAGFDCENLALWIRRVMAEQFDDWPLGCGRPALCKLPDGPWHCVLTVAAEELGVYVIGTRRAEHFVPWRALEGYDWHACLDAGNLWRSIAAG